MAHQGQTREDQWRLQGDDELVVDLDELSASGHTGRFVVAGLLRRGLAPVAVGRNPARLAAADFEVLAVPARTASIDDPISLDHAFAGTAAVINCAGPFMDTAEAVAAAALRARVHYLDVTAEQSSAQATLHDFGAHARDAGIVVLPAMGFYGGLADLPATSALGGGTPPTRSSSGLPWTAGT